MRLVLAEYRSGHSKFHPPVKYRFHYFSCNDVKSHDHSHQKKERYRKLTKSKYLPDWHEREKKCAYNDQQCGCGQVLPGYALEERFFGANNRHDQRS